MKPKRTLILGLALLLGFLLATGYVVKKNTRVPAWTQTERNVWLRLGDASGPGIVAARYQHAVGKSWTVTFGVLGMELNVGISNMDIYSGSGNLVRKAHVPDVSFTNWYKLNRRPAP
ncbi:MAG: hypothetical protein ACOZAO_03605 [Patescibacteria group bacterium]